MIRTRSPRQIVRYGQYLLVIGSVFLMSSLDINLSSINFGLAMFTVGAGLGLLASQLGSVNMSSVSEDKSSEVGGLQGTFQNLGSSLGTALIGSVMVASLTTGFLQSVDSSNLPQSTKTTINSNVKTAPIMPASQVETYAQQKGASNSEAQEISQIYMQSQLSSLKESAFFLVVLSVLVIALSRGIPNRVLKN
jgi:hypothetical protein